MIAFPITPKGVMNEIHHHIFLPICNVWRRNWGCLWFGRPQGIAPTDKSHQMYIVTIMHSVLIMTRTSVRLYECNAIFYRTNPIWCISQQLCITNY